MMNLKKLYHFFITIIVCYLMVISYQLDIKTKSKLFNNYSKAIPSNQTQSTIATNFNNMEYEFSKKDQFDDGLGAMNDIMIQGNLAYVAVQWGGLMIFNITDLTNPILLGSYNEPQETTSGSDLTSGIFIREDVAFVADGENGLLILNVSDPMNPIKIGKFKEDWRSYYRVFVEGSFAYVLAEYSDHIIVFDISSLALPVKLGEKTFSGDYKELLVKNNIIFLGDYLGSGIIVNASNPYNLIEITTLNDTQVCAINQNYLLTATNSNNLIIYNLTTLPILTMVINYSLVLNGTANYLCANDNFAFAGSTEEILMVNITNPTNPQNISKISNLNWFYKLDSIWIKRKLTTTNDQHRRTILLFTDYQKGLFIHNFSKAKDETLIGYYNCGMKSELVTAKDGYVYVVSMVEDPYYPSQLEIFTYNENSLKRVGIYPFHGSIWDLAIADGFAFLAVNNGVDVINISDPTNPTRISFYYYVSGLYPNWGIFYEPSQAIVYLCADSDGLIILDASDLRNIIMISRVSSIYGYHYCAKDVYVYNDVAFVADMEMSGGFGMIDVSDPWHPDIIVHVRLFYATNGIYVQDDLLYITAYEPALQIINVKDVYNPIYVGEYLESESTTGQFCINNNLCFLAQWDYGLTIIDLQNLSAPKKITSIRDSLTGGCKGVSVNGSNIFIADAWDGLEVWQFTMTQPPHIWRKALLYTTIPILSFIIAFILVVTILKRRKDIS